MIERALRKLRRAPEWIFGHLPHRGAILTYHRIASGDPDPYGIRVSEAHFTEHLDVLRRRARPMSLTGLHEAISSRRAPLGAVAVTLDDGYCDALTAAKPLLGRFEVPATAFIVTGQLGNRRGFWWDELHRVVMAGPRLPAWLELAVRGKSYRWRILADSDPAPARGSSRLRDARHVKRSQLFWHLYSLLLPLSQDEWLACQDRLLEWCGAGDVCPEADRPLTGEEVRRLADGGLLEIGSHTATHPQLPCLPASAQLREMRDSRAALEDITGAPVRSFAYPHGSFDAHSIAAAREAGFHRACTTLPDRLTPVANSWRLPRIEVPDYGGEEFERSLSWLFERRAA